MRQQNCWTSACIQESGFSHLMTLRGVVSDWWYHHHQNEKVLKQGWGGPVRDEPPTLMDATRQCSLDWLMGGFGSLKAGPEFPHTRGCSMRRLMVSTGSILKRIPTQRRQNEWMQVKPRLSTLPA